MPFSCGRTSSIGHLGVSSCSTSYQTSDCQGEKNLCCFVGLRGPGAEGCPCRSSTRDCPKRGVRPDCGHKRTWSLEEPRSPRCYSTRQDTSKLTLSRSIWLVLFSVMKFLSHIRSRSRLNNGPEAQLYGQYTAAFQASHRGGVHKPNLKLPARVLGEILAYICPHTQDEEYTTSEQSMIEDGCMLCDMRDLAQCALTSRQWAEATQNLL